MSCAVGKGKPVGKEKRIYFPIKAYSRGDKLRIRFRNDLGAKPYRIGAMTVIANGGIYEVTLGGKSDFEIPTGGSTYSDEIAVCIKPEDCMELRMFSVLTPFVLNGNDGCPLTM